MNILNILGPWWSQSGSFWDSLHSIGSRDWHSTSRHLLQISMLTMANFSILQSMKGCEAVCGHDWNPLLAGSQNCMEDCNQSIVQILALMFVKMLRSAVVPLWLAGRIHTGTRCGTSTLHSQGRCSEGVQTGQICPLWWRVHTASRQLVGPLGGCGASVHTHAVEGMSLAGDQDTDLSNDIQPSQIVCKNILQHEHTIQNRSWCIITICMLGLVAVTSYNWAMSAH